MVATITISDGVNTINLYPGARVRRRLLKGVKVITLVQTPNNQSIDLKKDHDIFEIDVPFKGRRSDYYTLWDMCKKKTNSETLTLTVYGKSYKVEVLQLQMEEVAGEGEMPHMICIFEVLQEL
ncbi:hypothetical protein [Candidatus Pyrohabitans sp.]